MIRTMKATIDKTGRLVIPRPLRERIGLSAGAVVQVEIEGSDLRIRPVSGSELREEGDLLVVPRTGVSIEDGTVRELIDADRYRR
jgi:AbrB family looped-hinge helix DNA binding protein